MKTYCVTCHKKTDNKNAKVVKTSNGIRRMKSICTVCGNKKSLFVAETCPL